MIIKIYMLSKSVFFNSLPSEGSQNYSVLLIDAVAYTQGCLWNWEKNNQFGLK